MGKLSLREVRWLACAHLAVFFFFLSFLPVECTTVVLTLVLVLFWVLPMYSSMQLANLWPRQDLNSDLLALEPLHGREIPRMRWFHHCKAKWFSFSFFHFLKCYWTIVDLQCCDNFCWITKWFSYIHTYSFLDSFPI